MNFKQNLVIWVLLLVGSSGAFAQQFVNPLFIPDTLMGSTYNLTLATSKVGFLPGDSTDTHGINAPYLGPTLIMNKWDHVYMNVTNNIADTTTMHWHGMHVSSEDDGGPHTAIPPGTTWSPDFVIYDEATTHWYHPHLHHKTATHVYKGAAGMIIIHDSSELALNLPHTYGVDDFPMIIQDKSFDSTTNQLIYTELADTMMVNGTMGAYLEVPAQMVRFRYLNASNQRVYNLGFPPQVSAFQIGSDGGLLEAPLPITRMLLGPGERAEVVVDFGGQNGLVGPLKAANSEMVDGVSGAPNGPGGGPNCPLDGVDFDILQFRIMPPTANAVTSLPPVLNSHDIPDPNDADVIRTKIFDADTSGFPYLINSTPFNMMTVNDTVQLGDTEIWQLYNNTDVAHPFHIHDIQFFIIELNGNPPPAHLAGRKDVVLSVPGDSIKFITVFEDFSNDTIPYMYHCHNLFHEDAGMMGQFIVTAGVGRDKPVVEGPFFTVYPNPAREKIKMKLDPGIHGEITEIELIDMMGKTVKKYTPAPGVSDYEISLDGLDRAMWFLRVTTREGAQGVVRFIRQ